MRDNLTADYVRSALAYNPETGVFVWKHRADQSKRWNGTWAGKVAGRVSFSGYVTIKLCDSDYMAHRLAYLVTNGEWPAAQIDHANGMRADNRLANIRLATHAQNQFNKAAPRSNKSGFKGVHWVERDKVWRASITVRGEYTHIGNYPTAEDAAKAYRAVAEKHHREFARF